MPIYIAYGSNLNVDQMTFRCPSAKILGTSCLKGWRLLFRCSRTGAYATIEQTLNLKDRVPVALFAISEEDEKTLDRYEGCPKWYRKKYFHISNRPWEESAFAYVLDAGRPLGLPSEAYLERCRKGYGEFSFDPQKLEDALAETACQMEEAQNAEKNYSA